MRRNASKSTYGDNDLGYLKVCLLLCWDCVLIYGIFCHKTKLPSHDTTSGRFYKLKQKNGIWIKSLWQIAAWPKQKLDIFCNFVILSVKQNLICHWRIVRFNRQSYVLTRQGRIIFFCRLYVPWRLSPTTKFHWNETKRPASSGRQCEPRVMFVWKSGSDT